METIFIPHLLRCEDHTLKIPIDQSVLDLATLTPVRGELVIKHQGTFLNVSATADTIINLACDRCLNQYNQRLSLDAQEIIWLDATADDDYKGPIELRVDFDDLIESVTPNGHFAPEEWLYEQLCLALPHRQLCDKNCTGLGKGDELPVADANLVSLDGRWGSLASLKNQLPE
jgi:uncharacterized protein